MSDNKKKFIKATMDDIQEVIISNETMDVEKKEEQAGVSIEIIVGK